MSELISVSKDLRFALGNERISYLFQVSAEGLLEHLHFGGAIGVADDYPAGPQRVARGAVSEFAGVKNYNLSDTPQEYPTFARSEQRHPALHVVNAAGNTTNTLRYLSHTIVPQKPELKGLPAARGGHSETLLVTLSDQLSELRVVLSYTVYQQHDVIARSAEVFNDGDATISLQHALSSCLDLPADDYELLHLRGSWAREFNVERLPVPGGRFVIDSACGLSSNHHNPFMAIMQRGASETHGWVMGTALMYSGNFSISVERGEFDSVRISAGINPFNFTWQLSAGESFVCPEALHVFSEQGLEGMSQIWHGFIREQISPTQFKDVARPSYLNSWEANYFEVDEQRVLELADQAVDLGLELLVIDDGWFQGRNDDSGSLGDWVADSEKFPRGIDAVASDVKAKGLKFGLWFEPEMVSQNSDLYRAHPEWVLGVPDRQPSLGRNQLMLDLCRADVCDYLYQRLDSFLSSGQIDYIKWDMNRSMTEIGSAVLPAERQRETAHRYMLGLYALLDRLTSKYPNVLFENCASGGNRFDLGMLRFMAQGWPSDMSEPVGRLAVINGASHLFPPSVMASYIGPTPSHQNGRPSSLHMRRDVGFFCAARGVSLNAVDLRCDAEQLQAAVALYNATAADVVHGHFRRLLYRDNEVCWQLSSRDGERVYIGYFQILAAPNLPQKRVYPRALVATANYRLVDSGAPSRKSIFSGAALMKMGLDLRQVEQSNSTPGGDFRSWFVTLNRL